MCQRTIRSGDSHVELTVSDWETGRRALDAFRNKKGGNKRETKM